MILGRVSGSITSTINHPFYDARKLLIVEKTDPGGRPMDDYLIAIDVVDAGVGERVLVLDEGNGARQVFDSTNAPVRSVIVGIVDTVDQHLTGVKR
jgi:microcompartment protein CcmK/EutM